MGFGAKEVSISLPGFGDGINSADPPVKIGEQYRAGARLQAASSIDFILTGSSIKRRPGMLGMNSGLPSWIRGLDTYLQQDGTDTLLTIANGKLFSILKESPYTDTKLYDLTGSGEAWMSTYLNKCWIANGSKNIKLENATAHQIGIDAPTAASAAAGGSGTLDAGAYTVYVCYARKIDGVIVLYSSGQSLGEITVSGSQAVVVTCPDSTDPQVTTKVVFMSDLAGSTYYYKGECDQGTNTITIADDTNKNAALIYDVVAADNTVPPAFSQILALDNRIWGVVDNVIYYSLQAGTVYDLERFPQLNYITYPYKITSIHALGNDLIVNTPAGIIVQPGADPSARFEHREKRFHFKYPRTVSEWSGALIGLTEDGIRIFDGISMSSYDVSRDVKEAIQDAYNGAAGSDHKPCGCIYRRAYRTEYHFGYRDLNVSSRVNNARMVLNLDRFSVGPDNRPVAPWETWSAGANYLTVDSNGVMFAAQSDDSESVIYTESTTSGKDSSIYIADVLVSSGVPQPRLVTGVYVMSLSAKVRWIDFRLLAQLAAEVNIEVHILTYPSIQSTQTVEPLTTTENVARFGIARFGVDRFAPSTPTHKIAKLPRNLNGYAVYFVIEQLEDDKNFEILQMEATGILTASRFT